LLTSDEDGDRGGCGHYFSFEEKKSLESRLATLKREAPVLLSSFYEPHLQSFSMVPGSAGKISVMSTCFALQAIFADGNCLACFTDVVNANMNAPDASGRRVVAAAAAAVVVVHNDTHLGHCRVAPTHGVVQGGHVPGAPPPLHGAEG
jgi:hypothetical protein